MQHNRTLKLRVGWPDLSSSTLNRHRGRGAWLAGASAAASRLAGVWLLLAAPTGAAEPPKEPMLRIETGAHTAMIRHIATDASGRWAVTASDDKTVRIWDVATGGLQRVLRPSIGPGDEGKLFAVAMSPDGAVVAAAGWAEEDCIYLFDRATGQLQRRLTGLPNVINHLAFSPDGRWLAATLGGSNGLRVWDWREGGAALADTAYGGDSYGAHWSADGRLVTTSYDGKLRLYAKPGTGGAGTALSPSAQVQTQGGKQPYGVAFSPDGQRMAVGYRDSRSVDVLDDRSLALLYSPDVQGVDNSNLISVAWSRDGQTLVAGGMWDVDGKNPARRWPDAGRGKPVDTPTANGTLMDLAALPGGGWLVGTSNPAWGVLSADGAWQARSSTPIADLRGSVGEALQIDATGARLQYGYEQFGKAPHRFDLRQRQLSPGTLAGSSAPRISGLTVADWRDTVSPTLQGQALKLEQNETARSLAISPDASVFALGADFRLRLFDARGRERWPALAVPGSVWGVNIPAQGRVIVAAYGDGTIRWHRMSDGQELLAFFPHADRRRWVLWTPSGYYDASPGAEDLIGWHVNRGIDQAADFFPASRLRERFWRPDVIDKLLETLDEAQALAQADEARGTKPQAPVSVAQVLPPAVDLLSGGDLKASTALVTVRVRGRTDADAPVTGWRLRLNGQALPEARGLGRQEANTSAAATHSEREFTLSIPPQDSEIQVFAENRHGVSTAATVRVVWAGATPAPALVPGGFRIQPKLYVLAVGVSNYQHKDIPKLSLPAKDASDFATAMLRQKGRLYRDVEVKIITEADASRDNVVDGLDWLQKQTTQNDMAMLFVAGHGVNDPSLGYTFLPWNADPDKLKRTGITMADISSTLRNLTGKGVAFLDTCHSGNVLGPNRRAAFNDLSGVINDLASADNGVVVFSSSTGRQFSLEDPAWGNGAFTKALIEGLEGKAAYQGDGRITHDMLGLYVSERVKALTRGQQSPVKQSPGGVADFPLAVVQ